VQRLLAQSGFSATLGRITNPMVEQFADSRINFLSVPVHIGLRQGIEVRLTYLAGGEALCCLIDLLALFLPAHCIRKIRILKIRRIASPSSQVTIDRSIARRDFSYNPPRFSGRVRPSEVILFSCYIGTDSICAPDVG
jgi:hypothetical protein